MKLLLLCFRKCWVNGGCGTTAGWKTSPYVHLLLGGKPQASCTPHSGLPGRARNFEYFYQDLEYYYYYCYLFKDKDNFKVRFVKIIYHAIQTRCCKTLYYPQTNSCTRCPWCLLFLALVVYPLHYSLNEVPVLGVCDFIQPAVLFALYSVLSIIQLPCTRCLCHPASCFDPLLWASNTTVCPLMQTSLNLPLL